MLHIPGGANREAMRLRTPGLFSDVNDDQRCAPSRAHSSEALSTSGVGRRHHGVQICRQPAPCGIDGVFLLDAEIDQGRALMARAPHLVLESLAVRFVTERPGIP